MALSDDEYVVYVGKYIKVEFYFTGLGRIPAREFYVGRTEAEKRRFFHIVQYLADGRPGNLLPKQMFNLEDDAEKIFAIKPSSGRYLGFFSIDRRFIITGGFAKQTQKLTTRERPYVDAAISRKNDYLARTLTGAYYEQD
jgi:Phage derived protein Gp49-like (DUF891)